MSAREIRSRRITSKLTASASDNGLSANLPHHASHDLRRRRVRDIRGLALVLAMIGIYGVVRYAVSRREREVAIRLALGAAPRSVVRLLMREGVVLVASGAFIGILLGALMARGLQSLLYGVESSDPAAFVGAPLVLLGVGVLAAFLPARRASRVDPASTLRQT